MLGAGARAQRLKDLSEKEGSGFAIVGFVSMTESADLVPDAVPRSAIADLSGHVAGLGATEVVLALEESLRVAAEHLLPAFCLCMGRLNAVTSTTTDISALRWPRAGLGLGP